MPEKPTYEELEKRIRKLDKVEAGFKRLEKELWESEKKFQGVVDDLPVLICSFLPDGEIKFVNKAYCEYFGKTVDELIGSNFLSLIPVFEQKDVMDNISALKAESPTMSHEHPVKTPDGKIRRQRWTNRALFDALGNITGYQSVGEDITDQKACRDALQERVKELNCLYGISSLVESENTLSGIFQGTVDLIPGFWQYPEITVSRICLGEQTYRSYQKCRHLCDECSHASLIQPIVIQGHTSGEIRVCYVEEKPESDEGPFLIEERNLINAISKRIGWIVERKQADDEIKLLKEKYEDLYYNAPTMNLSLDSNKIIVECNNTILNKLGYTKGEFIGKALKYFLTEESAAKMNKDFPKLLMNGKIFGRDRQFVTKNGKIIDVIVNATIEYDEHHNPIKTRASFEDITKLKRTERLVHNLSQMLIQAQEQERKLISCELHDGIAQNLSTLKLQCRLIFKEQSALSDEIKDHLTDMNKLIDLTVRDVRDLAYNLRPPDLDYLGLVDSLKSFCEEISIKNDINIDFQTAGIHELTLTSDMKINLYRLVQEGLNNIKKHAAATNAVIKLIGAYPYIILRIEDNGKGFDVKKTKYSKVHEKRMGLWGMVERVNLLQGNMLIHSQLNKGTEIVIKLPLSALKKVETTRPGQCASLM